MGSFYQEPDSVAALAEDTFRHCAADLHRFLRRRLRDPQSADDVTQEVFSRLVRVRHPDLVKDPRSYLFGIAFHVIRELRLQENRQPVRYDSQTAKRAGEQPEQLVADDMADRLNIQRQLEHALAELPEVHRAVLLMCKRDGLTYQEVARATGISIHMVEKHLIQARAKLLGMLWDL